MDGQTGGADRLSDGFALSNPGVLVINVQPAGVESGALHEAGSVQSGLVAGDAGRLREVGHVGVVARIVEAQGDEAVEAAGQGVADFDQRVRQADGTLLAVATQGLVLWPRGASQRAE